MDMHCAWMTRGHTDEGWAMDGTRRKHISAYLQPQQGWLSPKALENISRIRPLHEEHRTSHVNLCNLLEPSKSETSPLKPVQRHPDGLCYSSRAELWFVVFGRNASQSSVMSTERSTI